MTKTAILHIGTEKTGTTSIQKLLHANRSQLQSLGIDCPCMHSDPNMFWLPLLCYEGDRVDEMVLEYDLSEPSKRRLFKEKTLADLSEHISKSSSSFFLFSSEFLSSRLTTISDLENLKNILQPLFDDIRILVYLREPLSANLSLFSTSVKAGSTDLQFKSAQHAPKIVCDHKHLLSLWEEVFPGKISPRLFQKSDFVGGSLWLDFCSVLGIELVDEQVVPNSVLNESLSWLAMKVMAEININFPRFNEDGSRNAKRKHILEFIQTIGHDLPRYMPTKTQANEYNEYFAESNEWVRSRYFADRISLWDKIPQVRNRDGDPYFFTELSDTEHELVKVLIAIWGARKVPIPDNNADKLREVALSIESQAKLAIDDAIDILNVAQLIQPAGDFIGDKLYTRLIALQGATTRQLEADATLNSHGD